MPSSLRVSLVGAVSTRVPVELYHVSISKFLALLERGHGFRAANFLLAAAQGPWCSEFLADSPKRQLDQHFN